MNKCINIRVLECHVDRLASDQILVQVCMAEKILTPIHPAISPPVRPPAFRLACPLNFPRPIFALRKQHSPPLASSLKPPPLSCSEFFF